MTVPTEADLKTMFGLPPAQAIEYMKRKGFAITWDWHEVDAATHARAFTVAKAARLDILQDIKNELTDNLREGKTLRDFQKNLQPVLEAKGWWGKQVVVDSQGNAEKVQLGSPRRLATIYQTNMQSAYMAGRYASMLAAVKTHPYWMYIAINDDRTRPSHRALNGKVFRYDDPIWQYIFPPNGFNCRCRIIALSEAEVKRRGLTVESSAGKTSMKDVDTGVNKRTGEVSTAEVIVLRIKNQLGQRITFSPDPGFNGAPMQSHVFDDYLYTKAKRTLGDQAGTAEVQDVLLSPIRMQAWSAFIDRTIMHDMPQGKTMAFGVMAPQDVAYAKAQGADVQSGIMYLDDRQLVGAKARRHEQAGNALTISEWKALPKNIANPEQVLWDTQNKTLLYVYPSDDGRRTKIALRFNRAASGDNRVEDVATAFKVSSVDIEGGITGGVYQRVR